MGKQAQKPNKSTDKAFVLCGVSVPKGTFCDLYKKECMGKFCSVTPYVENCKYLKEQNAL